jgi:PAS domain S-box-containing protein
MRLCGDGADKFAMNPKSPSSHKASTPLSSGRSDPEAILEELAGTLLSKDSQSYSGLQMAQAVKPSGQTGEAQLQMEAARYRTLVELLPAITFLAVFDQGLNEVYVSPQIETIFGYSQREWVEDPVLWYERLHPEDRERWNKEFAETVARGRPLSSAYRFLARDGRLVWLHSEVRIVRRENGEPSFIHGVGFDITQSKEAERLASVARELARSNADLDQFAYIASHDLREPLRTVATYTQRLQRLCQGQLDQAADDCIARVINGARLMDRLIDDLYTYSRVGREGERKVVNCANLFSSVCANLETALEEAGAVVTADPLPAVMGVETELLRLFQNLIGNGVKFRGDRPVRVHVGVSLRGRYWHFSVRDNGIGIQRQFWRRIFGIGERLHSKTKYPGTGFGLAICQKIVEHHGGQIWLESEPGTGSTFFFTVPAA